MKQKVTGAAIVIMNEAIRADRDHQCELTADYVVGKFDEKVLDKFVPDYECAAFDISNGLLTIHKGFNDCDGATFAPDKLIIDIAKGYIPHDAGYAAIEQMAADPRWIANGWTESEIRKLWDIVLGQCLDHSAKQQSGWRKAAASIVARVYYRAVRLFGGIFHKSAKIILLIFLMSLLLTGCSIPGGFSPTDEEPVYIIYNKDTANAQATTK